MERTKKSKQQKTILNQAEEKSYRQEEKIVLKNCWGWENINEAACEVFNGIHSTLLQGQYVFGYRNTGKDSPLVQAVVVRFDKDIFGLGVITQGYTCLLPRIPLRYLEEEFVADLKKWKIEKEIVETFIQIINEIKNEITCN